MTVSQTKIGIVKPGVIDPDNMDNDGTGSPTAKSESGNDWSDSNCIDKDYEGRCVKCKDGFYLTALDGFCTGRFTY